MTAIDEIRAAIDKLEALKAGGSPAPWTTERRPGYAFYEATVIAPALGDEQDNTVGDVLDPPDADLIVTLHRTIDAQLTALRMAVDYLANGFHEDSGVPQIGIGTARAINGVTS